MYMPVSGEVLEFNEELSSKPEIINKDPYGIGWVIRIRMTDPAEANGLLNPSQYQEIIKG